MQANSQSAALSAQSASIAPVFNPRIVIPLLGTVVVLVVMNTMMFNLALPRVSEQFQLGAAAASWIVTGYSTVFAISSITYSRLSDFLPIRRLLLIGLLCLGGASIAGWLSHNYALLLVSRLVQASGAGSAVSLSLVLIARHVPQEQRGKSMSLIMAAASLGLGLGPVAGGFITQVFGWNALFLVTGVALLILPILYRQLPAEPAAPGSFDWQGGLLLAIGTTGLLLFLSNQLVPALGAGLLGLALFWLRITRTAEPFVQPDLLRNRAYMLLIGLGIFAYVINFATMYLLPQVLTHQYGLEPLQAGLILFPGALLSMLASGRIGRTIDRHGNRPLLRWAPWPLLAAGVLFALLGGVSYYAVLVVFMLMILGFTALNASVSNEMSRILSARQIGAGMGLFQLLQFFSGAFSVALCGSALALQRELPLQVAHANLFWGTAAVGLVTLVCSLLYIASSRRSAQSQ
ncbi:MFS transporter [Paenibacillus sp. IB182496]|uniref:MFS transporter n=1 Tax=Paenibacillus sabuli TaxID=2772509 RepID=A0A927BUF1_9BACL|nr:MFS transporter [Paenibacillus sabuli]MBD2846081.1 MFS transporter [Paenibacillus sabuli]